MAQCIALKDVFPWKYSPWPQENDPGGCRYVHFIGYSWLRKRPTPCLSQSQRRLRTQPEDLAISIGLISLVSTQRDARPRKSVIRTK